MRSVKFIRFTGSRLFDLIGNVNKSAAENAD